ncbi:uncharacterized protein DS421_17g572740 [Arachis hypogaea]|nr:uncharacterized protein DS421_17g572740 [Arachis hypogaea]
MGRQWLCQIWAARSKASPASSSSRQPKKKEAAEKVATGRGAKRALKREAADKAAAAKHQQHLGEVGQEVMQYLC